MSTGYTPIYKIEREGVDITSAFNERCTSMRIDFASTDGGDDIATFVLNDRDWRIAYPPLSENLAIHLGYEEVGMSYMGLYEMESATFSGVPKSITFRCKAKARHPT